MRTALGLLLFAVMGIPAAHAQTASLTADDQARLARQFAPVLVFHSAEKFFPTDPLYPLAPMTAKPEKAEALARLGTTKSRTADYLSRSLDEKAKLTTVYYRAYPARRAGKPVVVLEYWFYYVRDEYRVRGNVLPIWAGGSHPNDLEHVHLVLREDSDGKYLVDETFASAHEGKIPANRYQYPETSQPGTTRFLVERGSHAMAPDINDDGLFTSGMDGDSGSKLLWGIRDRGYSWPRYRMSYMDSRSGSNAVVFDANSSGSSRTFPYRLVSVDTLTEDFAVLNLTTKQRKQAFEAPTFWFPRIFGRDNGRSNELLVPSRAKTGSKSVGIQGVSSSERRLLAGAAFNLDEPGVFVGGRYSFLTRPVYVPDLVLQVDSVVTKQRKNLSQQFLISYPLDGFTRLMFGKSLVTDSLKFDRRQWDTVGTIEVRLGDMRVSATTRSIGPVRGAAKEFRLFYAFR